MRTIYTARVSIPSGPLLLERTFLFASQYERNAFAGRARAAGYTVKGLGVDHLLSAGEAFAEAQEEAASAAA